MLNISSFGRTEQRTLFDCRLPVVLLLCPSSSRYQQRTPFSQILSRLAFALTTRMAIGKTPHIVASQLVSGLTDTYIEPAISNDGQTMHTRRESHATLKNRLIFFNVSTMFIYCLDHFIRARSIVQVSLYNRTTLCRGRLSLEP